MLLSVTCGHKQRNFKISQFRAVSSIDTLKSETSTLQFFSHGQTKYTFGNYFYDIRLTKKEINQMRTIYKTIKNEPQAIGFMYDLKFEKEKFIKYSVH